MKLTKKDKQNITNAYNKKIEEYYKLTLDELKEIFNTQKLSSTYREALIRVVNSKMYELKESKIKELVDKSKSDEKS